MQGDICFNQADVGHIWRKYVVKKKKTRFCLFFWLTDKERIIKELGG